MRSRATLIIAGFALIKLLIPFVLIHPQFELQIDEYLYLADADHLSWGYIEMPPLLALLGVISKLLGGTIFTVRLWGGIMGAITVWVVGKTVQQLKGNNNAVFMACLAFLCAGFLRMHILFQPNFLDVFFWTLSSYFLVCLIDTNNKKYLYYIGICFGLGILGKYSTAFYIIGFAAAMLVTNQRRWLASKHFYFAMALGLCICLPNLVWQYTHHFPVMHHMELLNRQQLKFNSRADFIADQLLICFPSILIWAGGLYHLLFNRQGRKYISIAVIYTVVIALLLYFNGKGYYAAAMYPSLMAFGATWFSGVIGKKGWHWLRYVAPVYMLVTTLFLLPLMLPVASPETLVDFYHKTHFDKHSPLRWEDHKQHPLPQDFADMLGWKEIAEKTARIYHQLPDSVKEQTMLYGDSYGQAGTLSFYRKKFNLPEAYSDNASYIFWLPKNFTAKYFLFVTHDLPEADDSFFNHWQKTEVKDSVTNRYAKEFGTKIILFSHPDDSVKIIANQHIAEGRKQFGLD